MQRGAIETDTEEALRRLEASILPNISLTLEALLHVAGAGSTGRSEAMQAAELRAIAEQLATVARQVAAIAPPAQPRVEWPLRISA